MTEVKVISKATNEVEVFYLDLKGASETTEKLYALRKLESKSNNSTIFSISIKNLSENETKKFFNGDVLHSGLKLLNPISIYEGGYRLSQAMIDVIIHECANNENYCVHFYNTMKENAIEENFLSGTDFDAFKDFIYTVMMKVTADIEDRLASLSRISENIRELRPNNGGL